MEIIMYLISPDKKQYKIAIDPASRYLRVSIVDREGNAADTRGFFRDELGLAPLK